MADNEPLTMQYKGNRIAKYTKCFLFSLATSVMALGAFKYGVEPAVEQHQVDPGPRLVNGSIELNQQGTAAQVNARFTDIGYHRGISRIILEDLDKDIIIAIEKDSDTLSARLAPQELGTKHYRMIAYDKSEQRISSKVYSIHFGGEQKQNSTLEKSVRSVQINPGQRVHMEPWHYKPLGKNAQ